MGNITINKGLLFDERDLDGPAHTGFECLAERLHDHTVEELEPEDGWPLIEIPGIASERFGATHFFRLGRVATRWIEPEGDFRRAVLAECGFLHLP